MLALALASCADGGNGPPEAAPDASPLVPSFPPEEGDGAGTDDEAAATDDDADDASPSEPPPEASDEASPSEPDPPDDGQAPAPANGSGAPDEPGVDADSAEAVEETVTSMVTDSEGDTTSPLVGRAPDGADLLAGAVERTGSGDVTVTVDLAEAPGRPDDDTTMNVASFHDLTGDGEIDLELWLNHSAQGWFPSWRDNRAGEAAYGDDAGLGVDVQGARLELVVPADLVGEDVASWRWSLGLEWGRYEWLGTDAAAHDLAPDEGFVPHG